MVNNRRIVLASRPTSCGPVTVENFRIETETSDSVTIPSNSNSKTANGDFQTRISEGEILVKTLFASIDPYIRAPIGYEGDQPRPGLYNFNQFKDSTSVAAIGELIGGRCVGRVLESKNANVAPGDLVAADWKWIEYAVFNPDTELTFEKIDKEIFTADNEPGKIRVSVLLGALGVSGSHAYYGFSDPEDGVHPVKGETFVVSSAAGSIGNIVSQLGKVNKARTVGITSGAKAERLVKENLVDYAIDYKAVNGDVEQLSKKIKEACPNGIDAYYDNTRGFISDAVIKNLNPGARVYIGGGISSYNEPGKMTYYENLPQKDGVRFTSGLEMARKYLAGIQKARAEFVKLAKEGQMKFPEEVVEGFENIPAAFVNMMQGKNFGKMVVRF